MPIPVAEAFEKIHDLTDSPLPPSPENFEKLREAVKMLTAIVAAMNDEIEAIKKPTGHVFEGGFCKNCRWAEISAPPACPGKLSP